MVFVTNNSTKSRAGYLSKFTSLGLNVAAEEIYSSSYAAAAYLESINFPKDKKARSLPVFLQASSYLFLHACRHYKNLIQGMSEDTAVVQGLLEN